MSFTNPLGVLRYQRACVLRLQGDTAALVLRLPYGTHYTRTWPHLGADGMLDPIQARLASPLSPHRAHTLHSTQLLQCEPTYDSPCWAE